VGSNPTLSARHEKGARLGPFFMSAENGIPSHEPFVGSTKLHGQQFCTAVRLPEGRGTWMCRVNPTLSIVIGLDARGRSHRESPIVGPFSCLASVVATPASSSLVRCTDRNRDDRLCHRREEPSTSLEASRCLDRRAVRSIAEHVAWHAHPSLHQHARAAAHDGFGHDPIAVDLFGFRADA
jgi:hypothetical protein